MYHISFFSISLCCCCLFFLAIPHSKFSTIAATSVDIIDQTCKKCADEFDVISYKVCATSLQAVPVGHVTNLQGLALLAMELALENATNTLSTIKKLSSNESFDPFALVCLKDCLQLYSNAITTLMNAVGAFLSEDYDTVNIWVSAVKEAPTTCEEGFKEKEGEVSPLKNENYNIFQLCDIALCISHWLKYSGSSFLTRSSATYLVFVLIINVPC